MNISKIKDNVLKRIDDLLAEYGELRKQADYDDLSGGVMGEARYVPQAKRTSFSTRAITTIKSSTSPDSPYVKKAFYIKDGQMHTSSISILVGLLEALKADIEGGYLLEINELIHADIFADFLEMAQYLLNENYKDPAAVLTGGVLEEHLRKLCLKNNIPIEIKEGEKIRYKKASIMNDELKKKGVYEKLDYKNIVAWLDLRNNAAHGKYDMYNKEQVELMLSGTRNFITRFLA